MRMKAFENVLYCNINTTVNRAKTNLFHFCIYYTYTWPVRTYGCQYAVGMNLNFISYFLCAVYINIIYLYIAGGMPIVRNRFYRLLFSFDQIYQVNYKPTLRIVKKKTICAYL